MKLLDDLQPGGDPDALITIASTPTAFEAGAIVVQLEQEGIQACSFATADLGIAFNHATAGVPVQVRRADHARARQVLASSDSTPRDEQTSQPPRTPLAAQIARAVAIAIAILTLAGLIAVVVR